jgi:hypothetical protein
MISKQQVDRAIDSSIAGESLTAHALRAGGATAATKAARFARDRGEFGVWRYMFATESNIKTAKCWDEPLVLRLR